MVKICYYRTVFGQMPSIINERYVREKNKVYDGTFQQPHHKGLPI